MDMRFLRLIGILELCMVFAASAVAQKLMPVRLEMTEVDPTKIPILVAVEQGIFRKNGIDLDLYVTPAAREITLRRGFYLPAEFARTDAPDITFGGGFGMAKISSDATYVQSRVIVATLDPLIHWKIIARPGINRPEDLKGKRFGDGNVGDENHVIARVMCQQMGWDPRFDFSLLSASPDLVTLRSGVVDALIASEVTYASAIASGLGYHTVIDTAPWKIPIPGSGINVTPAYLRENRDTVRRFLKSLIEGIAVMKHDREASNRAMAKWFGITNPEHQKIVYDGTADMERKPYPSVEGIKMMMKLYDSYEMRKHKPEEFYDDSLIRELDKSGFIDDLYR